MKETITNLSHDLRTPLTAVCGYLDLLDKEDLSPDGRRYAKIIRERTQTMRRLTQEIFSYSALTAVRDTCLWKMWILTKCWKKASWPTTAP